MTGITIQQALEEIAYYDKISELEQQLNFTDHFLGQLDKDALHGAGESLEIGSTNFLELVRNVSQLKDYPGAPQQAIEAVSKYLEEAMAKKAFDAYEAAKPNIHLQEEVIGFLRRKYEETFKRPYSDERYNDLVEYYHEMNPALKKLPKKHIFKNLNEMDENDELPF